MRRANVCFILSGIYTQKSAMWFRLTKQGHTVTVRNGSDCAIQFDVMTGNKLP